MAYKVIKIGDKEVPMMAMSSVAIYHKWVFGTDLNKIQFEEKYSQGDRISLYCEMAFIMAKFAELKDRRKMRTLNQDAYLDWLEQFEYDDLVNALNEVSDLYLGQLSTKSQEKKEEN